MSILAKNQPMSAPVQDNPEKLQGAQSAPAVAAPVAPVAPVAENPVVNANPIINANPIVNAGTISGPGPIIGGGPIAQPNEEFQEYMSAGCTAVVPPGARKIYLIMVTVTMLVGAGIVYGLFKLLDL